MRYRLLPLCAGLLIGALPLVFALESFVSSDFNNFLAPLFTAVTIALGIYSGKGHGLAIIQRPLPAFGFAAFLMIYTTNWVIWPKGTGLDQKMWLWIFVYVLFPFILGNLLQRADLPVFFLCLAVCGLLMGVFVVGSYLIAGGLESHTNRYSNRYAASESLNPITQSIAIGWGIIVFYSYGLKRHSPWGFIVAISLFFPLLLGGSKGPAFTVLMTLLFLTFWTAVPRKRKSLGKFGVVTVLGITLWGASLVLPQAIINRFLSADELLRPQGTLLSRIGFYQDGLGQWLEYPLLGSGTSGNILFQGYAHNLLVQLLMETGIVGMCFFLIMLIPLLTFVAKTRIAVVDDCELTAALGIFIFSFIESQFSGTYMTLGHLWIMIGILAAWHRFVPPINTASSH